MAHSLHCDKNSTSEGRRRNAAGSAGWRKASLEWTRSVAAWRGAAAMVRAAYGAYGAYGATSRYSPRSDSTLISHATSGSERAASTPRCATAAEAV